MQDLQNVLETHDATRAVGFCAGIARLKYVKFMKQQRDAVSCGKEIYGYFKALHVNETKSYLRLSS
jgi:orotidine-5'-phosphate decarboxylase